LIKPIQPSELLHGLTTAWQKWQGLTMSRLDQIKDFKPKILLVEDERLSQRYTSALLGTIGCEVNIAETGNIALKLIENDYDLIFMDIGLPDTDGYALTQEIRKHDNKNQSIPIVALTAHVNESDRAKCLSSGMNDFLKKPATQDDLMNALSRWLIA
jgi:two-component system, OmpR family, aerobic respiration control sensor histidine kinase ArcB